MPYIQKILLAVMVLLTCHGIAAATSANTVFRIRKRICHINDSSCPDASASIPGGTTDPSGFNLSFPATTSATPSSLVFSTTAYLISLPAPTTAWIEAPAEAYAGFYVDGIPYLVGDKPVAVTQSSVIVLTATTPDTQGNSFDITFHLGDGTTATWVVSTLAEDGIMFTSIPQTIAYTGFPYGYSVETYSGNATDTLTLETLEAPDWLVFSDHGDWTGQLAGAYPSVPFALTVPTITSTATSAAQEGSPTAMTSQPMAGRTPC